MKIAIGQIKSFLGDFKESEYRKNKRAFLLNGEISNGSEQFGINGNNEKMIESEIKALQSHNY